MGLTLFFFHDSHGTSQGRLEHNGYVFFSPAAGDHRGVITSADGKQPGCERIRWYGYESFIGCREGVKCALPSPSDAMEANYCADGREPAEGVRINPCAPNNVTGTNFTVPAQQFNVIEVPLASSTADKGSESKAILYFGEMSQSASDGLKSHNLQAWVPLRFAEDGAILPMTFPQSFELDVDVHAASVFEERVI